MDEDDADLHLLDTYSIIPTPEIGGFICNICHAELSIKTAQSFKSHAKNRHKLNANTQQKLYDALLKVKSKFPEEEQTAQAYRGQIPVSSPLPPLRGLVIEDTKKCPFCDKLLKTRKQFNGHLKDVHSVRSRFMRLWNEAHAVKAQTVSKKKGLENFFPVETIVEEKDVASSTNLSCIGDLLKAHDPGNVLLMKDVPQDQREHSPFVFVVKPQERLKKYKLDMEGAIALLGGLSDLPAGLSLSMCSDIRDNMVQYYKEAHFLGNVGEMYSGVYLDIATSGATDKTRHFTFLDDRSKGSTFERYLQHTTNLVLMACRVLLEQRNENEVLCYSKIPLSSSQMTSASALLTEASKGPLETTRQLHDLLFTLLFQEGTLEDGPSKLFMYAYATCVCVTSKHGELPRYRLGIEVSSIIAGPLHFASCVALMSIKMYNQLASEEDALHFVKRCLKHGGRSGVNVLSDLRSQCCTLRETEMEKITYTVCDHPAHENCGFINGVEVQAKQVGTVLKNIQQKINCELFEKNGLFKGKPLPRQFREKQRDMVDHIPEKKSGYWFQSDLRNKQFVDLCHNWVKESNVLSMSESEMELWTRKAKRIVEYLVCAMHLSGGAPGRGTEIGVNSLMNRPCGRRTVFFVGTECILVPYYNKMRRLKMGTVNLVTRHLDAETSYLLKSYLLLVHHVVCIFKNFQDSKAGTREEDYSENFKDVEHQHIEEHFDRRWALLCSDAMSPTRVATIMNKLFEEFGFPLTFSEYRQWQRGYAKYRGIGSVKIATQIAAGFHKPSEQNQSHQEAAILQAGHSVRAAEAFYARIEDSFMGTSGKNSQIEMRMFQKASHQWHLDIQVSEQRSHLQRNSEKESIFGHSTAIQDLISAVEKNTEAVQSLKTYNENHVSASASTPQGDTTAYSDSKASIQRAVNAIGYDNVIRIIDELKKNDESGNGRSESPVPHLAGSFSTRESGNVAQAIAFRSGENGANNNFNALRALRLACGVEDAQFRSKEQEIAMENVYHETGDIAVILGTGMGKTATVLGPILFERRITIWISPLKELRLECLKRFESSGVKTAYLKDVMLPNYDRSIRIILVSPEEVPGRLFRERMKSLASTGNLIRRIVVDEAHEFPLSEGFRECMPGSKFVRDGFLCVPFVILTATASRQLLIRISDAFCIPIGNLSIIRGNCARPNLKIGVNCLQNPSFQFMVSETLKSVEEVRASFPTSSPIRILVACLTRNHVEFIQDTLQTSYAESDVVVLKCHSNMSDSDLRENVKMWHTHSSSSTVMVATEKLLTGTDVKNVRAVIIAGSCRSLVKFWQAAGRAGRGGEKATIVVNFHEIHLTNSNMGQKYVPSIGEGSFTEWAQNESTCRTQRIENFFNDTNTSANCIMKKYSVLCDVCEQSNSPDAGKRKPNSDKERVLKKPKTTRELRIADPRRQEGQHHSYQYASSLCEDVRNDLMWLRSECEKISGLCPLCIVQDWLDENSFQVQNYNHNSDNCVKFNASEKRGNLSKCFRCLTHISRGSGHCASTCPVLKGPSVDGPRCCAGCFLYLYKGASIHPNTNFSINCVFKSGTMLVMSFWGKSTGGLRKKMVDDLLGGDEDWTDERFGQWLVRDNPCGIVKALRWVLQVMKLNLQ